MLKSISSPIVSTILVKSVRSTTFTPISEVDGYILTMAEILVSLIPLSSLDFNSSLIELFNGLRSANLYGRLPYWRTL